jgi:predicted RNA binding protein YcfA (HicA-like mRNA interferase family)
MARIPVLSARKVLKALERAGFRQVGQTGSHIRLNGFWGGRPRVVIVPNHAEIAVGTMLSILRQAGWTRDDLQKFLS